MTCLAVFLLGSSCGALFHALFNARPESPVERTPEIGFFERAFRARRALAASCWEWN